MTNLRRTKLKAKRQGIDPKLVDQCNSHEEVYNLIRKDSGLKEVIEGAEDVEDKQEDLEDGSE